MQKQRLSAALRFSAVLCGSRRLNPSPPTLLPKRGEGSVEPKCPASDLEARTLTRLARLDRGANAFEDAFFNDDLIQQSTCHQGCE